jgi:hypothetical protein
MHCCRATFTACVYLASFAWQGGRVNGPLQRSGACCQCRAIPWLGEWRCGCQRTGVLWLFETWAGCEVGASRDWRLGWWAVIGRAHRYQRPEGPSLFTARSMRFLNHTHVSNPISRRCFTRSLLLQRSFTRSKAFVSFVSTLGSFLSRRTYVQGV